MILVFYPVFLNIQNKRCLVVGGGKVAGRKIKRLVKCGASVEVLSPQVIPEIKDLLSEEQIIYEKYSKKFLGDYLLVFAATDSKQVNRQIYYDTQENNILINVANDLDYCDFIVPALVDKGDLQIAVSSGGKSPALAKKIKERLQNEFSGEYEEVTESLGEIRELIKNSVSDQKKRSLIFNKLAEIIENK